MKYAQNCNTHNIIHIFKMTCKRKEIKIIVGTMLLKILMYVFTLNYFRTESICENEKRGKQDTCTSGKLRRHDREKMNKLL